MTPYLAYWLSDAPEVAVSTGVHRPDRRRRIPDRCPGLSKEEDLDWERHHSFDARRVDERDELGEVEAYAFEPLHELLRSQPRVNFTPAGDEGESSLQTTRDEPSEEVHAGFLLARLERVPDGRTCHRDRMVDGSDIEEPTKELAHNFLGQRPSVHCPSKARRTTFLQDRPVAQEDVGADGSSNLSKKKRRL